MRSFSTLPIKQKLTLVILISSGIVLLLACAALVAYDVLTFRRTMVNDLTALAKIIGANNRAALAFNDQAMAGESLASLKAKPFIASACLYTTNGTILVQYPAGGRNDLQP